MSRIDKPPIDSKNVTFTQGDSGLSANNVEDAIKEVVTEKADKTDLAIASYEIPYGTGTGLTSSPKLNAIPDGDNMTLTGGTNALPGSLTIEGTSASSETDANGGDLIIKGGVKDGSGADGKVIIPSSLQLTGSDYGANKVLTSDASGNAEWKQPLNKNLSFMGGGLASWKNEIYTQIDTNVASPGLEIYTTTDYPAGVRFIPEKDTNIKSVKLNIKWTFDDPSTGNFNVRVYALDANHLPIGSALATSASLGHAEVSSSYAEKTLTFSSGALLEQGKEYAALLYNSTNGDITFGVTNITPGTSDNYVISYEDIIPSGQEWVAHQSRALSSFTLTLEGSIPAFNFTEDIKLAISGLSPDDNIIEPPTGPYFLEDGEFLYVEPNLETGGDPLEISLTSGALPSNAVVVAFRDGEDLVAAGYRMKLGYAAKLGGGAMVFGPTVKYLGDHTTYPTTGSWTTNTAYSAKYWRDGEFLVGEVLMEMSGAPNSTNLYVNLPSGLVINGNRTQLSRINKIGKGTILDQGTGYSPLGVGIASSTLILPIPVSTAGSHAREFAAITEAVPITIKSGDKIAFNYRVPIVGWDDSGNVMDVAELDLLAGGLNAVGKDGSQTITAGNTAKVKYRTTEAGFFNDVGTFDGETLTVQQKGELVVSTSVNSVKDGGLAAINIVRERNSVGVIFGGGEINCNNAIGPGVTSALIKVEPGDKIYVNAVNISGVNDLTLNATNSRTSLNAHWKFPLKAVAAIAGRSKFIVKKLSGSVTSDGAIADLAVTGLTIGRVYQVGGHFDMRVNQGGSDPGVTVTIACGTDSQPVNLGVSGGDSSIITVPPNFKFTAKATSMSFTASSATAASYISPTNTRITVTELPNDREVTSF